MSPREFVNTLDGWKEREEYRQKAEWERARYIAKSIVGVQVDRKDKHKVEQAFRLPWDGENTKKTRLAYDNAPEQMQDIEEEMLRAAKKIK